MPLFNSSSGFTIQGGNFIEIGGAMNIHNNQSTLGRHSDNFVSGLPRLLATGQHLSDSQNTGSREPLPEAHTSTATRPSGHFRRGNPRSAADMDARPPSTLPWELSQSQKRLKIRGGTFIGGDINYIQYPTSVSAHRSTARRPPQDYPDVLRDWIHCRSPTRIAESPPTPEDPLSSSRRDKLVNTLMVAVVNQVESTIPISAILAPAATLLMDIFIFSQETQDNKKRWDLFVDSITNLTGDLCAVFLCADITKHSKLVRCLQAHLGQYSLLIERGRKLLDRYKDHESLLYWSTSDFINIRQDASALDIRFKEHRLVNLTLNGVLKPHEPGHADDAHLLFLSKKLEEWLQSPPDMKQKQHDTEKLWKEGTGGWFLEGSAFMEWLSYAGSIWIEGQTIFLQTLNEKSSCWWADTPPTPVGFFYFDVRSKEAQSVEIALRRIILQLSAYFPHPYESLNNHHDLSNGQKLPSYQDLYAILQKLLHRLGRTYIILDALDECASDELDQLVDLILMLRAWTETPLHLLITSQPRRAFTDAFQGINCIPIEINDTQRDITVFLSSEFMTNSKLDLWRQHAKQIVDQITHKSRGMFRLAACLLVEFSHCTWEDELEKTLTSLPDDLFAVYDRFLQKVRPKDWRYVEAIFCWLMFSGEPLTLEQLADAIAFDFSDHNQYIYKPNRRGANREAILAWLEGLVILNMHSHQRRVSLAHASVRDYLMSRHFANRFRCDLHETISHTFISTTCISYLLYFEKHQLATLAIFNYPLAEYAAFYWCHHLLRSHNRTRLLPSAMRLLEPGSQQYDTLVRLHKYSPYNKGGSSWTQSPLHLCCREGFLEAAQALINDPSISGNAIQPSTLWIAAWRGFTEIAQLLINKGVDINAPGGDLGGTALSAASRSGQTDTLRTLLLHGADPNLTGGAYGSPLIAAAHHNHYQTVHLLLKNGASINLCAGPYGNALTAASVENHAEVVQLLLNSGADPNLVDDRQGIPLCAAANLGHLEIVELLVTHGADVNRVDGRYGSPLEATLVPSEIVLVSWRSPTQPETATSKKISVLRYLLDHGADTKGLSSRALEHARSNSQIVALLEKKGIVLDRTATPRESFPLVRTGPLNQTMGRWLTQPYPLHSVPPGQNLVQIRITLPKDEPKRGAVERLPHCHRPTITQLELSRMILNNPGFVGVPELFGPGSRIDVARLTHLALGISGLQPFLPKIDLFPKTIQSLELHVGLNEQVSSDVLKAENLPSLAHISIRDTRGL
ncbi:hypothetical protein FB45DRAFT_1008014 [Roridomyces roridus]|uniref:Nephrocystin 3-like N-terminal domain-containing protein n=1 Tax=Roridomyces roridus TaxID=1738132 RepID=A0AAD7BC62_9AGAR|nr:hypothetical protein FB45DRAFT_1008014 [Roridomyces roridus]